MIELMIAQGGSIVAHGVHGPDHRVGVSAIQSFGKQLIQTALKEVAIVKQEAVGGLGPLRLDQMGQARQPGLAGDAPTAKWFARTKAQMQVAGGQ